MDVFNTYATDEVAEVEGRWQNLTRTARVLVARTGNTRYQELFRKKLAEHELDLGSDTPESAKLSEEILVDIMARTILLGWEGLTFQGREAPYSVEMAKTMLRVKDFRKRIQAIADSHELYRAKSEEKQGNDSAPPSSGSFDGVST